MIHRVYFDLETVPDMRPGAKEKFAATISPPANMSKPETIAKWEAEQRPAAIEKAWLKTSLDGGAGKVAVVGWAFDDQPTKSIYSDDWSSEAGERESIAGFFTDVAQWMDANKSAGNSVRPLVIGHNHIGFDMRFLFRRCVVLRLPVPFWLPVNARPWDSDLAFDTMVAWAGPRDYVRMDVICEALGIPTKGSEFGGDEDIDGSKVWDYVKTGRISTIARYCEGDVERTRLMHKRMIFEL